MIFQSLSDDLPGYEPPQEPMHNTAATHAALTGASPNAMLPPDVLGEIFKAYCLLLRCGGSGMPKGVLSIAHVCRLWRMLFFKIPGCGNVLRLHYGSRNPVSAPHAALVEYWLSQPAAPLELEVIIDPYQWGQMISPVKSRTSFACYTGARIPITDLIVPHFHNCRFLRLSLPVDLIAEVLSAAHLRANVLESLHLQLQPNFWSSPQRETRAIDWDIFASAPYLKEVAIENLELGFGLDILDRIDLPFAQLTTLTLGGRAMTKRPQEIVHLLCRCKQLKECTLLDAFSDYNVGIDEMYTLPTLESLTLMISDHQLQYWGGRRPNPEWSLPDPADVFRHLKLPALKAISFRYERVPGYADCHDFAEYAELSGEMIRCLENLLGCSSPAPRITALSVSSLNYFKQRDVEAILRRLSDLESLTVIDSDFLAKISPSQLRGIVVRRGYLTESSAIRCCRGLQASVWGGMGDDPAR